MSEEWNIIVGNKITKDITITATPGSGGGKKISSGKDETFKTTNRSERMTIQLDEVVLDGLSIFFFSNNDYKMSYDSTKCKWRLLIYRPKGEGISEPQDVNVTVGDEPPKPR